MMCNHCKTCFISKEPSSKMAPASERTLGWNAVMAHRLTSALRDNSRREKWNLTLGLTSGLATSCPSVPGGRWLCRHLKVTCVGSTAGPAAGTHVATGCFCFGG